jgi:hypothetical protein
MPGKGPSPIFSRRINAEEFIKQGTGLGAAPEESPHSAPSDPQAGTGAAPQTVLPREVLPVNYHRDSSATKPRKIAMTYKHSEQNYKRLKHYSQRLEISMGELIDEALESKFAEWKAQLPPEPNY